MTLPLEDSGKGYFCGSLPDEVISAATGKDTVALGPGIGRNAETAALIRTLVEEISLPMVIDADGLNAVSEDVSEGRDFSALIGLGKVHQGFRPSVHPALGS